MSLDADSLVVGVIQAAAFHSMVKETDVWKFHSGKCDWAKLKPGDKALLVRAAVRQLKDLICDELFEAFKQKLPSMLDNVSRELEGFRFKQQIDDQFNILLADDGCVKFLAAVSDSELLDTMAELMHNFPDVFDQC
eukprot:COSAG04_NODE_19883_length_406_cov_0.641694_1_plen_135_part_11